MDYELVWHLFQEALADNHFRSLYAEAEDGEEVWMLANLVPSSAGQYQCKEIIEFMGFEPESDDLVYTVEYAEELTEDATRLLKQRLRDAGLVPQGHRIAFGWWPEGCWGLVIYKDES